MENGSYYSLVSDTLLGIIDLATNFDGNEEN